MISYSLLIEDQLITVSLDVSNPHERSPIILEGDTKTCNAFQSWLAQETGAFGHLIGQATTAIDLDYVMSTQAALDLYKPVLIEGTGLVKAYKLEIPTDAVS